MGPIRRKPGPAAIRARSRRGRLGDLPALYAILASARENRQFETVTGFEAAASPIIEAGLCWVLSIGPDIAGFAAVDGRAGSVDMLYVHPAHEGKTVGRALLRRCLDDLIRLGHRSAWLVTARDTRAERFYRAQGWIEIEGLGRGSVKLTRKLSGL